MSKQVLVNQWTNLVKTLVATVIADRPAAEKAGDADLCVIAKRLTAVSCSDRLLPKLQCLNALNLAPVV